jgi:hypothetical protein
MADAYQLRAWVYRQFGEDDKAKSDEQKVKELKK